VRDFAYGIRDGVVDQVQGLWTLLTDLTVLKSIAEAFIDDPRGTLRSIVEGVVDDVDRVLNCGPHDIGFIIGQNLDPFVAVRIVSNLADIANNPRLNRYVDETHPRIRCTVSTSFIAGTQVITAAGLRPIETLVTGELVATKQTQTDPLQFEAITKTHQRIADGFHQINTSSGVINATPEHPFYLHNKGWIEAKDLLSDDVIATLHGSATVYDNQFQSESARVYNLTVDWGETYFVLPEGSADIEQALWVHNTCWDLSDVDLPASNGRINERATYDVEIEGQNYTVYIGLDADGNPRVYDADSHPPEHPRDLLGEAPRDHIWITHADGTSSIRRANNYTGPRMVLNEDGNAFIDYPGPERILNSGRLARNLGGPAARPRFPSQAHHIIPDQAMRDNALLRRAHDEQLFDFDSADNGIFLAENPGDLAASRNFHNGLDVPYHNGPHTNYSNAVIAFADQVLANLTQNTPLANLTDTQIQNAVQLIRDEAERLMLDPAFRDAAGRLH